MEYLVKIIQPRFCEKGREALGNKVDKNKIKAAKIQALPSTLLFTSTLNSSNFFLKVGRQAIFPPEN
ncbi:MAG: hypothetical protein KDD06_05060 [Phaeodactylibacter sp.]|nr:hypothetical protein [Phaeodactylibacter sp.]MCB9264064.1 hypothetical protein [Lewinellaceae bacterium]